MEEDQNVLGSAPTNNTGEVTDQFEAPQNNFTTAAPPDENYQQDVSLRN